MQPGFVLFILIAANVCLIYWIDEKDSHSDLRYFGYFCLFQAVYVVFCIVRIVLLNIKNFYVSQQLHLIVINSIFHSSLIDFLEKVPIGRIINRLSRDILIVDQQLGWYIGYCIVYIFGVIGALTMQAILSSYYVVVVAVFALVVALFVRSYYLKLHLPIRSSRELVRLDSIARSPITANLTTSLQGLSVIRAFRKEEFFFAKQTRLINTRLNAFIANQGASQWFGLRIQFIAFMIAITTMCFTLFTDVNPLFAGLTS